MLPIVNRLGSRYTPRRKRAARPIVRATQKAQTTFFGTPHRLWFQNAGQCSTAMTVSPPRTVSPTCTRIVGARRQKHVHARAEFHDAEPIAGVHLGARPRRGRRRAAPACRRSAARRSSARGDRSRSRCARSSSRHRGDRRAGIVPGCRSTRVTRPDTGTRFTCTSIGDRKMLTCCQVPGGAASATASPATSTRPSAGDSTTSSSRSPDANVPIGIAKEEQEESAEDEERKREQPGDRGARRRAQAPARRR